ncbi:unnamed protein product [Fraxinus pennsylvanica]|uniref:Uncharacterized protein n=1 Tax=Fraxinus pennsylvanica TaxID=56036 RepID=A0AAD2DJF4_9LAMI|nr:unnamed protein product [Fraxinus pennsylvanica]
MANEREESLLNSKKKRAFARIASHAHDELHSFRIWLKWLCVDQSNAWTTCLSWFVFLVLAILVPALSHFVLACSDCDSRHSRPYDTVVQLSLSGVAALSFICLSYYVRKFGIRRFLFLDKLCDESEAVREGYTEQLHRSLKVLFIFVLPCFAAEAAYKIWWYASGGTRIPFLGNALVSDTVACFLELCSCAELDIYITGELVLCSVSLLAGLMILLRSATRITHKALAVTCLAAKWHVGATIDSFDTAETETPVASVAANQIFPASSDGSSDIDDVGDEEDELDNSKFVMSYAYSTLSFQKRQALVTYFENNRAGITLYGFILDRTTLHTIFGIEFSLVLWLLGKTISSLN